MIKNNFGFSLIEILIAVGILAGAIAAVMPVVSMSSLLSVEDEKLLQAVTLANNKMADIEKEILNDMERGKFPDEMSESGSFEQPFDDYSWEYTVKKVEIPISEVSGAAGGEGGEGADTTAAYANVMQVVSKEMSKAVREISLVVSWQDAKESDKPLTFSLTTHMVNIK
ncbi:MAG: type II secretion system protein [Deltaproteobacteria bacterium]|nr:type II secretion system protein [Deltaproteobacteria bacterium]